MDELSLHEFYDLFHFNPGGERQGLVNSLRLSVAQGMQGLEEVYRRVRLFFLGTHDPESASYDKLRARRV